jgi:hypothetical protein
MLFNDGQLMTEPQQINLTVTAQGKIKNAAGIAPEMLAQLQSPEGVARIRKMYKDANGTGRRDLRKKEKAPEVKAEQRNFSAMKPPGMSSKEFRRLRRATLKSYTKQALKMQRAERNKFAAALGCQSG